MSLSWPASAKAVCARVTAPAPSPPQHPSHPRHRRRHPRRRRRRRLRAGQRSHRRARGPRPCKGGGAPAERLLGAGRRAGRVGGVGGRAVWACVRAVGDVGGRAVSCGQAGRFLRARVGRVAGSLGSRGGKKQRPRRGRGAAKNARGR